MWTIQSAFLLFTVCRLFLSSLTLCYSRLRNRSKWSYTHTHTHTHKYTGDKSCNVTHFTQDHFNPTPVPQDWRTSLRCIKCKTTDSSLPGCCIVSTGRQIPTFRTIRLTPCWGVKQLRFLFVDWSVVSIFRNVRNFLPFDEACHGERRKLFIIPVVIT